MGDITAHQPVPDTGQGSEYAGCSGFGVQLPLAPLSEASSDLQLSLLLMLISACTANAESVAEAGPEELAQQVSQGVNYWQ